MADPHSGVEQCLLIDAALWMRDGILREGLRHSGTCRWTSPTGELRGGVSFQVNTIDVAYPTVRLLYTMPGTGELDHAVRLQTPSHTGVASDGGSHALSVMNAAARFRLLGAAGDQQEISPY